MLDEQIEIWKEQYQDVYAVEIAGYQFFYRVLARDEYEIIMGMGLEQSDIEDLICETATLYPEGFNFKTDYGYSVTLSENILDASHLLQGQADELYLTFTENMEEYENQIDCVIHEAFPEYSLEVIAQWTVAKTMFYLSRAEWILANLKGVRAIRQAPAPQQQIQQQAPQKVITPQERAMNSPLAKPPEAKEQQQPAKSNERRELTQEELEMMLSQSENRSIDLGKDSSSEKSMPELKWFGLEETLRGTFDAD